MSPMRKKQIGVIGSMLDISVNKQAYKVAEELGVGIAKNKAILLYGFEGDFDSLSFIAAKSAEKTGGQTMAFNWGKYRDDKISGVNKLNSMVVQTGMWRGGGREFSFILSCDAVIAVNGGAGTLTEIAIAYQANIPVITLERSGGWSSELADKFLDARESMKILGAKNPKEAVKLALNSTKERK